MEKKPSVLYGLILTIALMLFVLTGWFVGMQNSKAPMLVAVIQNVANILISLLLVYGLGMKIGQFLNE